MNKRFENWYNNADMPMQDKDGNWYDAEDGISYAETIRRAAAPIVAKHPMSGLKLAELQERCRSLQRAQLNAANKHRGTLDVSKSDEVVATLDALLTAAKKATKAQLLEWVDANSDASRYMNNQLNGRK